MNTNLPKPCPFCSEDPGYASYWHGRYIVGCESDECYVNPKVSAPSVSEAWARWNHRGPIGYVAKTEEELAGAGGIK